MFEFVNKFLFEFKATDQTEASNDIYMIFKVLLIDEYKICVSNDFASIFFIDA